MHLVKIESAWPTVRGVGGLAQALGANSVRRVHAALGHLLAVGRHGTALVAVDAVPSTGWQLPDPAQAQLAQTLAAAPTDPIVITDALKPLLISTASTANARIVGVYFQAAMNMRKHHQQATAAGAGAGAGAGPAQAQGPIAAPASAVPGPNAGAQTPGAGPAAMAAAAASAAAAAAAALAPAPPPPDPAKGPFVWIVRENGILELWRLVRRKYAWTLLVKTRLPTAAGAAGSTGERAVAIADVAFQPVAAGTSETTMVLVYTEVSTNKQGQAVTDVWAQCLLVEHTAQDQTQLQCSLPKTILRGVPPVAMAVIDNGVAFLPPPAHLEANNGAEDLCYFWSADGAISSLWMQAPAPQPGTVVAAALSGVQPVLLSVVWGRALNATDAGAAAPSAARMLAYATHPVTRELLVLDTVGQITVCTLTDGALQLRPLVALKDAPLTPGVALAYHRLHVVVADATALHLFHIGTGHAAGTVQYPSGSATGVVPSLWQISSGVAQLGIFHARIGIWQLQTHTIANTLTVAEGHATTSETIFAAEKWGFDRLRAKHILEAALVLVKNNDNNAAAVTTAPTNEPVRAALALLERELIETPALAIAVLNGLPQYRTILAGYLTRFLQKFDGKYRSETTTPIVEALRTRTPLGEQLRPLIEDYLASIVEEERRLNAANAVGVPVDRVTVGDLLDLEHQTKVAGTAVSANSSAELLSPREGGAATKAPEDDARFFLASDVRSEVLAIFNRAAANLRATKQAANTYADRSRLEVLAWAHAADALAGLLQGLRLDKFDESELPDSADDLLLLQALFREESPAESTSKDQGHRSSRPPLFELVCLLLVQERPRDLAAFIALSSALMFKAQAAQAKSSYQRMNQRPSQKDLERGLDSFRRRAINAVVPLDVHVIETYRDPSSSLQAITQLLACVGEGATGLRLVLQLRRWDDAINLAQELRTSNGDQDFIEQHEVFYAVVTAVVAATPSVAAPVLDRVWKLAPSSFGVFDMLRLLRTLDGSSGPVPAQPLVVGSAASTAWTVGPFRAQLLDLIRRESRSAPV